MKNYCPVSLFPIVSKIIWKNGMFTYVDKYIFP